MSTKTKYFSSSQVGASALTNTAGSLIALLDAVLINGWGTASPSSVVVAGGVATATWAAAHPYISDSVMLVSGATNGLLNGEKRVTVTSSTTVTFDASGVPDGAAAGAISTKVAPLGWTKLYTGTNLAAYKPSAPEASGCVLRVDDTGTTVARVRGYEAMTDVNTGTGAFPTTVQVAAPGLYWAKAGGAGNKVWHIFGDDRGFYFLPVPSAFTDGYGYYFGDGVPLRSGDPYFCVLRAHAADFSNSSGSATAQEIASSGTSFTANSGMYVARTYTGLGTAVEVWNTFPVLGGSAATMSGSTSFPPFPSPVDNGLHLAPIAIMHSPTTAGPRGWYPGVYACVQNVATAFANDDPVDGNGAYAGKRMRAVKQYATTSGMLFFDALSDWR